MCINLTNLVHAGGEVFLVSVSGLGGYVILLDVSKSLRIGSFLKPIISGVARHHDPVNMFWFCERLIGNVWQRLKNDRYENHL